MSTQQDTRSPASLQLGVQKYLYTGYFVAGCAVAFLATQIVQKFWGEGHDTAASLIGTAIGLVAVIWAWKSQRVRGLAQETLDELAKVTWPTREETWSATVVVLVTAIVAAVVIFGLDRFWNWFTDYLFR